MSKLRVLNAANDLGILKLFFQHGLIYQKVQLHYEIYLQVCAEMKKNGNKKRKAVIDVSIRLGISQIAVWKALSTMK